MRSVGYQQPFGHHFGETLLARSAKPGDLSNLLLHLTTLQTISSLRATV